MFLLWNYDSRKIWINLECPAIGGVAFFWVVLAFIGAGVEPISSPKLALCLNGLAKQHEMNQMFPATLVA